jgi:chloramphenicol O-acetyltransferase type B
MTPFYKAGRGTYGKPEVIAYVNGAVCTVGNYCSIAGGVTILTGGEHRTDTVTTFPFKECMGVGKPLGWTKGDVTIGNDVWIGHNVLILSGVTIGNGAVIGAGAVVTGDVRPYAIVIGNPAKELRTRFTCSQVECLQQMCWWDWPEDELRSIADILTSDDVEMLIAYWEDRK